MTAGDVTETKWVRFTELEKVPATRKTLVWEVSGSGGPRDILGWVEYHGMWHAFIFRTRDVTIRLSVSCLRAIADFVEDRNRERRGRHRKPWPVELLLPYKPPPLENPSDWPPPPRIDESAFE